MDNCFSDGLMVTNISDIQNLLHMVLLLLRFLLKVLFFTDNAVKPCEMSCSSFTQDSDIYMDVSWDLCPYEDFNGYVDNYIVTLDCSNVSLI